MALECGTRFARAVLPDSVLLDVAGYLGLSFSTAPLSQFGALTELALFYHRQELEVDIGLRDALDCSDDEIEANLQAIDWGYGDIPSPSYYGYSSQES